MYLKSMFARTEKSTFKVFVVFYNTFIIKLTIFKRKCLNRWIWTYRILRTTSSLVYTIKEHTKQTLQHYEIHIQSLTNKDNKIKQTKQKQLNNTNHTLYIQREKKKYRFKFVQIFWHKSFINNCLTSRLKRDRVELFLISLSKEFHSLKPIELKELHAVVFLYLGSLRLFPCRVEYEWISLLVMN